MKPFDYVLGKVTHDDEGALDVDMKRGEVILVVSRGRELRFNPDQAEQLAAGLIKGANMVRMTKARAAAGL